MMPFGTGRPVWGSATNPEQRARRGLARSQSTGRSWLRAFGALLVMAVFAGGLSTTAAASTSAIPAGPIEIGGIYPMSGPLSIYGIADSKMIQAVVNKINASGGIDGHKIKTDFLDSAGEVSTAVSDAEQLISDHVVAVIGPDNAGWTATIPIFTKAGLPVFAVQPDPGYLDYSTYPTNYITYPDTPEQATSIVDFLKARGGSIGLMSDTVFGPGNNQALEAAAKAQGVHITGNVVYSPTATDVTTQILQLKASGAKTVMCECVTDFGVLWQSLKAANWNVPFVVTAGAVSDEYSEISTLGLSANVFMQCTMSYPTATSRPSAQETALEKLMQGAIGTNPTLADAVHYADEVYILKYAIEKAKSTKPAAVNAVIHKIKNMSFSDSTYTYNFTKGGGGWPLENTNMCHTNKLGQYDLPYLAAHG
jgi:branched-chain amino acid transport system substrate-binding protein